jgi:hypothetical protein
MVKKTSVSEGSKFSADGILADGMAAATVAGVFSTALFSGTVLQEERKIMANAAAIVPVSLLLFKINRAVLVV